jgi:transposase
MTKPEDLTHPERTELTDALTLCPDLNTLTELVRQVAHMLTTRQAKKLPAWMETAHASGFPTLRSFVNGLRLDLPAVIAGLTLPYSNSPMEGTNTKVNSSNDRCTAAPGSPLRQRILLN